MNHSIVNFNAFILTAMFSAILANWTAKFSEHLNRQLNTNVSNKVTMTTKDKPEGRRDPEMIQVDPVEPGTPGKMIFSLSFIGHLLQSRTKPVETNRENAYFFMASRQKLKPPPNEWPISPLPLSKVV